jgi:trehalose 6-phosphate synthase
MERRVDETPGSEARVEGSKPFSVVTTDLSEQEFHGYYEEFANRTLWPLLHGRLDLCQLDNQAYETYRHVNLRFARTLFPLLQAEDRIWIHDFHLILLGKNLQGLGVTAPLGFFLHVPFPQTETLAALPWRRELLSGLCAYDLVGFQTSDCANNFREAVVRGLGGSVRRDGSIVVEGHVVELEVLPVGIDPELGHARLGAGAGRSATLLAAPLPSAGQRLRRPTGGLSVPNIHATCRR